MFFTIAQLQERMDQVRDALNGHNQHHALSGIHKEWLTEYLLMLKEEYYKERKKGKTTYASLHYSKQLKE